MSREDAYVAIAAVEGVALELAAVVGRQAEAGAAFTVLSAKLEAAKLRAGLAIREYARGLGAPIASAEESREAELRLEHQLEQIDHDLDLAGVPEREEGGRYLGVQERVRLLISREKERAHG